MRDLLEFGCLAAHVLEEAGATIDLVAREERLAQEAAAARIQEYNALAERLNGASDVKVPIVRVP